VATDLAVSAAQEEQVGEVEGKKREKQLAVELRKMKKSRAGDSDLEEELSEEGQRSAGSIEFEGDDEKDVLPSVERGFDGDEEGDEDGDGDVAMD
jgi:hypothetical protein